MRRWLARLRYGDLTRDRCEVCGARLRARQRVEIRESTPVAAFDGIPGGFDMAATYCRKDAPRAA